MKGKILEIDYSGSWSGKHGEMHTYQVRIQTDDQIYTGEANAKSDKVEGLPYKIGDEVEFEHTPNAHPGRTDKLKIKKEGDYEVSDNYSGGKPRGGNRAFALSYAKDLAVARMTLIGADAGFSNSTTGDIIKQADAFVKWLDS